MERRLLPHALPKRQRRNAAGWRRGLRCANARQRRLCGLIYRQLHRLPMQCILQVVLQLALRQRQLVGLNAAARRGGQQAVQGCGGAPAGRSILQPCCSLA